MAESFFSKFGKAFVPEKIRPTFRKYLYKAGIQDVPYNFFGILFFVTAIITLFIFLYILPNIRNCSTGSLTGYELICGSTSNFLAIKLFIFSFSSWFIIQIAIVGVIMAAISFYLDMVIFNRTKEIEKILPDFLEFVSGNLRGGMTVDKALWSAIKPKFGILANEIKIAAKQVMTGEDIEKALTDFSNKYQSPILSRSMVLIVEGIRGGAELADVIDKVVENIRNTRELEEKMISNSIQFQIFVSAIVLLIAPVLFALSYHLLLVLMKFAGLISNLPQTVSSIITFSKIAIKPEDFTWFTYWALGIISVFAAMIIAVISRGEVKQGIKYIPAYLAISILVYKICVYILGLVFSGMMNI